MDCGMHFTEDARQSSTHDCCLGVGIGIMICNLCCSKCAHGIDIQSCLFNSVLVDSVPSIICEVKLFNLVRQLDAFELKTALEQQAARDIGLHAS